MLILRRGNVILCQFRLDTAVGFPYHNEITYASQKNNRCQIQLPNKQSLLNRL